MFGGSCQTGTMLWDKLCTIASEVTVKRVNSISEWHTKYTMTIFWGVKKRF
jgi:hypothetical protein